MRKVTFPRMGYYTEAFKLLIEELGFEVIMPPKITQETIKLGVRHSSDMICFPYKVTLGNLIQSLDAGADTILVTGLNCNKKKESCRFLYYYHIQEQTLRRLGYEFDMIYMKPGLSFFTDMKKASGYSYFKLIKIIRKVYRKIKEIEDREFTFEKKDINIGLVGEAYTLWAHSVNYDIIKKLREMNIGVDMSITLSWFLKEQIHIIDDKKHLHTEAKKYLPKPLGGHGWESIVNTIDYAHRNFDAVFHFMPLTCFTEDTNITIGDFTVKPIKDIEIGEMVLTHKGRFKKVTNVFCHQFSGKLINIDCGGVLKLNITPNHQVLALKRKTIACTNREKDKLSYICRPEKVPQNCDKKKYCFKKEKLFFEPTFMSVDKVKKGDFLVVPKPNLVNKITQFQLDKLYTKKPKWDIETENYFLVPIKKINDMVYEGKVFNLEVEKDNSYVANNLAVHNCMPESLVEGPMDMISDDYDIPLYHFSIDEGVFDTGFDMRIKSIIRGIERSKKC